MATPERSSPDQFAWFRSELANDSDQPTIVFGHHPLVVQDSAFPISPSNSLDAAQAETILQDYAANPGMFLHHAGHTHRNKRTISPLAPGVLHQEIAAGKEYPGGFSLLRLHTEGYALNFYKSRSDLARRWSERSRQEIAGSGRSSRSAARVSDRNVVALHDLSGLTSPSTPTTSAPAALRCRWSLSRSDRPSQADADREIEPGVLRTTREAPPSRWRLGCQ